MTEWLKLMLEEIARKQAEQENGRAEQALRESEPPPASSDKPRSPRRK